MLETNGGSHTLPELCCKSFLLPANPCHSEMTMFLKEQSVHECRQDERSLPIYQLMIRVGVLQDSVSILLFNQGASVGDSSIPCRGYW